MTEEDVRLIKEFMRDIKRHDSVSWQVYLFTNI